MSETYNLPLAANVTGSPVWGHWNDTYVPDPITGLVAFPNFLNTFKRLFVELLYTFDGIGLAIGDVDHLKTYVESIRNRDPLMFGHLAGNAFMSKLGVIGLGAFEQMSSPWRCLATFGGDEIILACAGCSKASFVSSVHSLSEKLAAGLPRTVSFAHGWFMLSPEQRRQPLDETMASPLCISMIAMVDRALFNCKAQRDKLGCGQLPAVVMMRTRCLRGGQWTLGEQHEATNGLSGECDQTGSRFRGTSSLIQVDDIFFFEADHAILNGRGSLRIVIHARGRTFKSYAFRRNKNAACVLPRHEVEALGLRSGEQIEFEVEVPKAQAAVVAPPDLVQALQEAHLCLDVLHPRDRHQVVQMVRESREREIRSARISAAVEACRMALAHQQKMRGVGV